MLKKARVSIYTFIAVFVVVFSVGAVAVPLLLTKAQAVYYRLQADVNARQARAMKRLNFLRAILFWMSPRRAMILSLFLFRVDAMRMKFSRLKSLMSDYR